MACVLPGCAVDQAEEVAAYREVLDLGPAPAFAPGDPLSLADAAAITNALNERLSIEGESYLQALIDRQRAAAGLLPTADLAGVLTFRESVDSGGDGADGGGSDGTFRSSSVLFDAGPRLQYTLLTGMTDLKLVRSAELTAEQRRWLLLDLRESILLELAQAYYNVLIAERQERVLLSSLAVQEERLRDIRARTEVGFARPLDVSQIESQVSGTRVQLLDAQERSANARSALALLTGVDTSASDLTDGLAVDPTVPEMEALLGLAAGQRQDLAAGAAIAAAVREEVDAEIGRYYPSVGLNLDYFLIRDTPPTDRDWLGLLTVNLPIFSAGRIDAGVRDAWSRFRQAVLDYSLTRREVRRDVEDARADLAATRARVDELNLQVRAAEQALHQAEGEYSVGLGTNLERITAQDDLLSAQLLQAQEELGAKVAYLRVMRAVGTLTPALTGRAPDPAALPPRRPAPESPFLNLPTDTTRAQGG